VIPVVLYNPPRLGTDRRFLQRTGGTVWAADIFTKTVWTLHEPAAHYVLNVRIGAPLQLPKAPADFSPDDVERHE
jgi:hypothetical protein